MNNQHLPSPKMRIGELSKATGISRETIHFYLREGLLPPPEKVNARVSYFDAGHLARLSVIKQLKKIHFPLAVIKEHLEHLEGHPAEDITARIIPNYAEYLGTDDDETIFSGKEIVEQTGLSNAQLDRLEDLGVLQPEISSSTRQYSRAEMNTAAAVKRLLEAGMDLEALRFARRYAELIEQEHGFIFHHLIRPAEAAGRRNTVSGAIGFEAMRVIEAYLRRQFRRRYAMAPHKIMELTDPLSAPDWKEGYEEE